MAGVSFAGPGYAVPGTVLALGLLTPFALIDGAISGIAQAFVGREIGLVVSGSGAAVVIAFSIRVLVIATGLAEAGLARIPPDLDGAARICGANPARRSS